jgi:ribosomal protein S18 acetylase RimI-like enzyme
MFNYKTLETTSIEIVHKTFLDAFSDYQVRMDLPLYKLKQMLQRRGYVSEISMGAFKDELLVGLVLNGFRNWNGKPTVYDTGTGVIGDYRKQGITSSMLLNIRALLKEREIEQYLLEVIQINTPAVELYKKQGFQIIRNLVCYKLDKNKYNPISTYEVEHFDTINSTYWTLLTSFWDFIPSWQNSIDSINAASDTFKYCFVHFEDAIVGYGIIDKKTGDIPQIAVHKQHRRKGIGRSIVTELLKSTESQNIAVINVDEHSKSTRDFLLELGFQYNVSQFEMMLKI